MSTPGLNLTGIGSADICGRELRGLAELKTRRGRHRQDQRQHRRHKAKTASTRPRGRSTILCRKQTTGDMHLSCSHPSEATTHIASDCKAKNHDVQPLRKGSVDHKRLRSDEHRFPLSPCWTNFELKHYTRSTGDQRAIDVSQFHKNQGTPLLQS